jgi:RNAse (barnase) inhibitor barstar
MATKTPTTRIEFKGLRSKAAMLQAIGEALHFPEHYGANLDALYDCLTDLPLDKRKQGMAVELAGLGTSAAAKDILAVFQDAAAFWQERGRNFNVTKVTA